MNGFKFNGKHTSSFVGIKVVTNYDVALLPEFENNLVSIPKRDGVIDFGRTLKERTIPVRFLLQGNTIQDYFQKALLIADWLNVDEVKELILDAIPDKRFMARPTGNINPERVGNRGYVDVDFIVPDGVLEALVTKTLTITQNSVYTNSGTKEAYPKLTITAKAAVAYPKIMLNGTNSFILLNTNIATGDIIVVDMEKRTVTKNKLDARNVLDVTSRYFKLPKGTFSISANSPNLTIALEYRERWV